MNSQTIQKSYRSVIRGVGHYVPENIVRNADLEKVMETTDAWITERTGIKERRFETDGIPTSSLAQKASEKALAQAGMKAEDVDMIIAATLSPDYYFPGIGVLLQRNMKMAHVPALDIRAQCSGLVYGLATADAFIRSGQAKRILLACAEVQHPVLDMSTGGRDMAVLFGDGAGSLILEAVEDSERPTVANAKRGVIDSIIASDGTGAEVLAMKIPGTAKAKFITEEDVKDRTYQPRMDGKVVFKNAITRMVQVANALCERNGVKPADIAMVFPHQANFRINEMVRESLGLAPERVFNNIHKYGNTTAATIPISMSEAVAEKRVKEGDLVLTLAFGAGFTWGANLIRW
jgi:3-oxoacyl-[acyl-carrier-protein] synthase-3